MRKKDIRIWALLAVFSLFSILIIARLFYWQVIRHEELTAEAEKQYWISFEIPAQRGKILSADKFPLVSNEEAYLMYASIPDLKEAPEEIATKIAPLLDKVNPASAAAILKERLSPENLVWAALAHKINPLVKRIIEELDIKGIGFKAEWHRGYPEGSMAAHLLGFVGADVSGRDKGYHGLEGYYERELRGRPGYLRREKDASGRPILLGEAHETPAQNGSDLVTSIDRAVQYILEEELRNGLERYGAKSGTVIVMEPKTGKITGMVSLPDYDPREYWKYNPVLYVNPAIALSFEPGSIFKVIVMAAAINEGAVTPETICDRCGGPRVISGYKIETWNGVYPPKPTMIEVIQQSNNVGMVFVSEKLGGEKMLSYFQRFGFGELTGIDLEDEFSPKLRPAGQWSPIDLATASFGQGIAVTPIQMVRAVGAIANQGKLVKPMVVSKIITGDREIEMESSPEREIIKPLTARIMKEIMVNAVEKGEAKWARPTGYRIAGKTGTAQIPVAGHYDEEKTIASFIGFAPADEAKFVMLVTLREPTSSPWGSETAAPLWFDIARRLFIYYGIQPEY